MKNALLTNQTVQSKDKTYKLFAFQFSLTLTLLAMGILFYKGSNLDKNTFSNAQERGTFLFNTLTNQINDSLYFNNVEDIRKITELLIQQQGIKHVSIFTESGQYLLDTKQDRIPSGFIDSALLSQVSNYTGPSNRLLEHSVEFVGGIYYNTTLMGGLYFELDVSAELLDAQQLFKQQLLITIALLILASGLSFALAMNTGATRKLKVAEANFQQLIEQSPIATAIYEPNGSLYYGNPSFWKLMLLVDDRFNSVDYQYNIFEDNYFQEPAIKSLLVEGFSSQAVEIPAFAYRNKSPHADNSINLKDNINLEMLWLDLEAFPLLDETSKANGAVVVYQNISKEKNAEIEQAEINAQLQQSQKLESLGIMAGGIAHDFNNLLAPIMGNAELIELTIANKGKDASILSYVQSILSATKRAADLCGQMLTYAGSAVISRRPLNLSMEVEELNNLFKSSLSKKTVFTQSLPMDIPLIDADQNEIRQIILNLLLNASDALEGGVGHVSLKTGTTVIPEKVAKLLLPMQNMSAGKYVFLEVADTGCGMNKETLQNLFNPFFSTKSEGRGLGLSAVLGIVKQHSAGLKVESNLGEGTLFRLYFPISETKTLSKAENKKVLRSKYSGKMLLVDDEPDILKVGSALFSLMGFNVHTANNGREAVEKFKQLHLELDGFVLVVLDVLMPVLGGEEALEEIRSIDSSIPVIMASGFSTGEVIARVSTLDNVIMLSKPYGLDDIKLALSEVILG